MTRALATGLAVAALFMAACRSGQKNAAAAGSETAARDAVSGAALPLNGFLAAYDSLREAFFRSDTAAADAAAPRLDQAASSLPLRRLAQGKQYDSAAAAAAGLHATLRSLLSANSLHDKRVRFARISDLCWQLLTAAGTGGKTVYLDLCPMFGDGSGVRWLSGTRAISNPYYGAQMPDCGEVTDSVKL